MQLKHELESALCETQSVLAELKDEERALANQHKEHRDLPCTNPGGEGTVILDLHSEVATTEPSKPEGCHKAPG